ncbi:hypothetical protein [Antrihabitans stalactiti]|uniref:hypothetical protein n=1 Tax=Antrihabitans stalactiti TaxID=2584121 RepID=UPI00146B5D0F|nr:hypothetical protein [Antrihabitans stalactiti]
MTGIAIIVFAANGNGVGVGGWFAALALIGYGGYIAFTKRSYWVSSYIYLVPIFGIGYMYFKASGKA